MPFQITKTEGAHLPVDAEVQFRRAFPSFGQNGRILTQPGSESPQRVVCVIEKMRRLHRDELAACYREIFDTAAANGWHSIAVPLCPSELPTQEVYRIAGAEISRALEKHDMDVFLTVRDEQNFEPASGRLSFLKEYIRKHYHGLEAEKESIPAPREPEPPAYSFFEAGRTEYAGPAVLGMPAEEESPAVQADAEFFDACDAIFPAYGLISPAEEALPAAPIAQEKAELVLPEEEIRERRAKPEKEKPRTESWRDRSEPVPRRRQREKKLAAFSVPAQREEHRAGSEAYFAHGEERANLASLPVSRFNPETLTIRLDESFSECVLRLIDRKGLSDPECYSRANLSRAVFNRLKQSALNPEKTTYRPSKSTALALAVALELGLDEARDLLQKAGYALSHSSKGDVIVEYYLDNGLYDIFELNEVLFRFGEPLLGSL